MAGADMAGGEAGAAMRAAIAAVAAHPGFDAALIAYADGIARLYRSHPHAVSVIGNLARFGVLAAAVVAQAPVSVRQLSGRLLGPGIASRGRVGQQVRRLQMLGAMLPEPGGRGGGRRWRAAPWAQALLHDWLRAAALPAAPWRTRAHDLDDPAVLRRYFADVLESARGGRDIFAPFPNVGALMRLAGGHALLVELVLASGAVPDRAFALSRSGVAVAYGLSRSHVLDMLGLLLATGSLARAGRAELMLAPALAAELRGWAAALFVAANATLAGELLAVLPPVRDAR